MRKSAENWTHAGLADEAIIYGNVVAKFAIDCSLPARGRPQAVSYPRLHRRPTRCQGRGEVSRCLRHLRFGVGASRHRYRDSRHRRDNRGLEFRAPSLPISPGRAERARGLRYAWRDLDPHRRLRCRHCTGYRLPRLVAHLHMDNRNVGLSEAVVRIKCNFDIVKSVTTRESFLSGQTSSSQRCRPSRLANRVNLLPMELRGRSRRFHCQF